MSDQAPPKRSAQLRPVGAVGRGGRLPVALPEGPVPQEAGRSPSCAPAAQISPDELIGWTRGRLAHYKCPVGVSFAPALARTAYGKLQKQAIRSSLRSLPVS